MAHLHHNRNQRNLSAMFPLPPLHTHTRRDLRKAGGVPETLTEPLKPQAIPPTGPINNVNCESLETKYFHIR